MRLKIEESENKKEFKPFMIKLEVETIEEARLLFHVFNREYLRDTIFNDDYPVSEFNQNIADDFDCDFILIEEEIKKQGFKL